MAASEPASNVPYISVVVAVRDGATTLQRCLDSVVGQTYQQWELIVIDGDSSDGTQDILERNARGIRYWISEPDGGICSAWNKALPRTRGTWVLFLGADDRLRDDDVLARMAVHLREAEHTHRVVYGRIDRVDGQDQVIATVGSPWAAVRQEFRRGMTIPHPGTFHHRTLSTERGVFDESYRISGDYEFLLRELLENDAKFIPDVTVTSMRIGGISDNSVEGIREVHRARRAHGLTRLPGAASPPMIKFRVRSWVERTFGSRVAMSLTTVYRFLFPRSRHPLD